VIRGERERQLLSACVAASVALHAAALVLGPRLRDARIVPPQVLSVVLAEAPPLERPPEETARPPPPPKPETPRARARPAPVPPPPRTVDSTPAVASAPAATASEAPRPQAELPSATPAAVTAPPAQERASLAPPDYRAAYLNNPAPAYPRSARRNGEQGTVTLRVHVGTDGVPTVVELERSSGSSALDAAARESVKSWRFVPARRGDEKVAAWVIVPVVFRLAPGP
jgi:protein TonB